MQQDSNKKIENERPKASGTLKVENNPSTVKRLKIITKSNRNIKMKNQKGKEKVVEKKKRYQLLIEMMIARIVVNYLVILKNLMNQIIKAIYVICSWHCVSNHFTYFGTFIQQKER